MATEEYKKDFLQSDTLEDAKEQLSEVYEANPDAVIFVEEEGKECIIEHGKQLNFVPSGGTKGQVLTTDEEGNPEWGEGLDPSNYLTSKQAAQKYYPKVDGEDLANLVNELDKGLGDKEDRVVIEVVSGETLEESGTLSALVNRYYRFDEVVNTLAVTLPNIPQEENPRLKSLVLSFTTGDAPSVMITADVDVDYFSGYSIEADTSYELNIMFNGLKWIVAYGVVE